MHPVNRARRVTLQRLATLGITGTLGLLRSGQLYGTPAASANPIPGVQGGVIGRDDPSYELWRQSMVWHRSKPARRPDYIVQPRTEDDVMAAIRYAARNKLKVAMRSGGHNPTGPSLRDGGLCIDCSALTKVEIDGAANIAVVQTGTHAYDLMTQLLARGLCFPTPHCPSVGMGGFLLGGGLGWNNGYRSGVATLNIEAVDVVTADGQRILATRDNHPDLRWAARGGGPGIPFAILRFHLKTYPAPKAIRVSTYILPLDRHATMTGTIERMADAIDPRVEILALLLHNPEAPPAAPPQESKVCYLAVFAYGDSDAESRQMLQPFAQSEIAKSALASAEFQDYTFERLFPDFFGTQHPGGYLGRYAAESIFTDEPGKALAAMAPHFREAPSPICHVIASYNQNLKDHPDAMFSAIARHYVGCFAIWDDEADDERNFSWLDETIPLIDPFGKGHYVNEVEARRHPDRIRQCYTPEKWEHMQAVRRKYDPNGVFHTYLGHGQGESE